MQTTTKPFFYHNSNSATTERALRLTAHDHAHLRLWAYCYVMIDSSFLSLDWSTAGRRFCYINCCCCYCQQCNALAPAVINIRIERCLRLTYTTYNSNWRSGLQRRRSEGNRVICLINMVNFYTTARVT